MKGIILAGGSGTRLNPFIYLINILIMLFINKKIVLDILGKGGLENGSD